MTPLPRGRLLYLGDNVQDPPPATHELGKRAFAQLRGFIDLVVRRPPIEAVTRANVASSQLRGLILTGLPATRAARSGVAWAPDGGL